VKKCLNCYYLMTVVLPVVVAGEDGGVDVVRVVEGRQVCRHAVVEVPVALESVL
jgi:hypothetical protein